MGMPWIQFNGIDSRDMGVIMERLPDFHRPKANGIYQQVSGRDGRMRMPDGSVDVYQTTIKVNCHGAALKDVYAWLSGSGWMISSNEPERKIDVDLYAMGSDSRMRLDSGACWDSVTFTVYCQPYRYFVEDAIEQITATPHTLTNPGTAACRPRIRIEGTGDVVVMIGTNQMDFEGLTDGVIVDCDLMDCLSLDETQLLNGLASMDSFPTLAPGANIVSWTGDVSKMTVEMRCRDL